VPRTRWTDERIDDLARTVLDNDARLDVTTLMASRSAEDLEDLHKHEALRDRSRFEQIAIVAALLSPAVTLILGLVQHH
jgi:hypothetical protein